MSSHGGSGSPAELAAHVEAMEKAGVVTRTFRRLDPERRAAVVAAILEEAAAQGPAALNVKRVAERAQVSVGALYTYFPDRAKLLDFAVELVVGSVVSLFRTYGPMLAMLPLPDALAAYVASGIEWSRTQGALVRFLARAAYQGDPGLRERVVKPIGTAMRETVRSLLQAAAARGELRPEVDLEAASRVVNALSIAVCDPQLLPYLNDYFQVTDASCPPPRTHQALVALVLHGLTRTAPAAKAKRPAAKAKRPAAAPGRAARARRKAR